MKIDSSDSLSSTSKLTLCTHWSLMSNTAPPHWVVRSGKSWLVPTAHYGTTAPKKGLMSFVAGVDILRPELVLLARARMSVARATQRSNLAQEGALTIQTRPVRRLLFLQIIDTNTSRPWDTSWYNRYDSVFAKKKTFNKFNSHYTDFSCFKRNPSERDLCPCITLVLPWINL